MSFTIPLGPREDLKLSMSSSAPRVSDGWCAGGQVRSRMASLLYQATANGSFTSSAYISLAGSHCQLPRFDQSLRLRWSAAAVATKIRSIASTEAMTTGSGVGGGRLDP